MADGVVADYVEPSDEIRATDGSIDPAGLLDEVTTSNSQEVPQSQKE